MASTAIVNLEIEFNEKEYYVEVEVEGRMTDESFDHEFGTEVQWGQEVVEAKMVSCLDEDDKEVTDKETLDFINKYIEGEEFEDVEFDFYEDY